MRVTDLTTHNNNFIRSGVVFATQLAFKVTPGDKYKFTLVTNEGIKDTYWVLTDGSVNVIHVG